MLGASSTLPAADRSAPSQCNCCRLPMRAALMLARCSLFHHHHHLHLTGQIIDQLPGTTPCTIHLSKTLQPNNSHDSLQHCLLVAHAVLCSALNQPAHSSEANIQCHMSVGFATACKHSVNSSQDTVKGPSALYDGCGLSHDDHCSRYPPSLAHNCTTACMQVQLHHH